MKTRPEIIYKVTYVKDGRFLTRYYTDVLAMKRFVAKMGEDVECVVEYERV